MATLQAGAGTALAAFAELDEFDVLTYVSGSSSVVVAITRIDIEVSLHPPANGGSTSITGPTARAGSRVSSSPTKNIATDSTRAISGPCRSISTVFNVPRSVVGGNATVSFSVPAVSAAAAK